jgi:hypothetical protein
MDFGDIWQRKSGALHVRFGSLADICSAQGHVRFTPESGHGRCKNKCSVSAKSGPSRLVANSTAWGERGLLFDPL